MLKRLPRTLRGRHIYQPYSNKQLPNLTVRRAILELIRGLPVQIDHLKRSGIGKTVMGLLNCKEVGTSHTNKPHENSCIILLLRTFTPHPCPFKVSTLRAFSHSCYYPTPWP